MDVSLGVAVGHIRCAGGAYTPAAGKIYQEDLITPGILPLRASSRNWMRETPNLPMKPRGRPLIEQRLRMRVGDELRGSFCSFFCAEKNSSSEVDGLARMAFSSARFALYFSLRLMR